MPNVLEVVPHSGIEVVPLRIHMVQIRTIMMVVNCPLRLMLMDVFPVRFNSHILYKGGNLPVYKSIILCTFPIYCMLSSQTKHLLH